jgi:hypothetical protein
MALYMDTETMDQEVLLNINTSFCRREYCDQDEKTVRKLSQRELLKTLCWDGLLPELLPEICTKVNNRPLTLWELLETQHLFHLRFGNYSERLNSEFSLNPFLMMDALALN